jgi:hypothetical protein
LFVDDAGASMVIFVTPAAAAAGDEDGDAMGSVASAHAVAGLASESDGGLETTGAALTM